VIKGKLLSDPLVQQWAELEQLLVPYLPTIQAKQQEVAAALVDDYKAFAGVEGRLQELCITARP